jgi:hypothetical protein
VCLVGGTETVHNNMHKRLNEVGSGYSNNLYHTCIWGRKCNAHLHPVDAAPQFRCQAGWGGEGESHKYIDRQTNRQMERQRQKDRHAETQTDTNETDRPKQTQTNTDRHRQRQTGTDRDGQRPTATDSDRQGHRERDRDRDADRDRDRDRQTQPGQQPFLRALGPLGCGGLGMCTGNHVPSRQSTLLSLHLPRMLR